MATTPTLSQLAARVALLDGQGLAPPIQGFVQQTTANIAGVKSDINGVVLSLEASINNLISSVQALTQSVNLLLGLAGLSTTPPTVTPPTT